MSSKPKTSNHIEVSQPSSEVGKDRREVENLASEGEIERRAYEIYLERGEQPAVTWMIGCKPNMNFRSTRSIHPMSRTETMKTISVFYREDARSGTFFRSFYKSVN